MRREVEVEANIAAQVASQSCRTPAEAKLQCAGHA